MEQQITVTFATVLPDLRKSAGFVTSRLQVCVWNAGVFVEIWHEMAECKSYSSIAFRAEDAAI
jgi:hypothetical protein